MRITPILTVLVALWPAAAAGAVLYKSVDANGVVMFSDVPPPSGARIVEQREVRPGPESGSYSVISNGPSAAAELAAAEQVLDSDAILAKANAKLDEAERALALARRSAGPTLGAVRLAASRLDPVEEQRIEHEKRNVKMARARLMELLRDRRMELARR